MKKLLPLLFCISILQCSKPFEPDFKTQVITVEFSNDDYIVLSTRYMAIASRLIPELTKDVVENGYTIKEFKFEDGATWHGLPYVDEIGIEYACGLFSGGAEFTIYNGMARKQSRDALLNAVNRPVKLKLALNIPN